VLTENFFMTNKEEVDWLLTETAKRAIVECHVRGIINYIASL
jgi:N-acetylmuramoyl-L-alanine amidase